MLQRPLLPSAAVEPSRKAISPQTSPASSTARRTLGYAYNYLGGVTTEINYKQGFTLFHSYDSAGRLNQVSSNWVDAQHPANLVTGIQYDAAGAISQLD